MPSTGSQKSPLYAIGFLGNTRACGDSLKKRRPVFSINGSLSIPTTDRWTIGDVRLVERWKLRRYVTILGQSFRHALVEGEVGN